MFNFKKIASVASSALMLSSTVGLAMAANYPAPFVQGGNADVAIVYGSGAAIDLAASPDIIASLSSALQTTTSGSTGGSTSVSGEAYPLFTGASRLYLNDTMNNVRQTLTDTDLPTILADGDFSGNVDADYTQTIILGSNPRINFAQQPTDDDDPQHGVTLSTNVNTPVYNLSVSFDRAVAFNHTDSEGEELMLFGQRFIIGSDTSNTELVLFKSSETVSLSNGGENPMPSEQVTVGGETYTIRLVTASDTSATIEVTNSAGQVETKEVNEDDSKKINGLEVAVKRADETEATNTVSAEILIGSDKVVLQNGNEIKVGSDEDTISNTIVTGIGNMGSVTTISIAVAADDSDTDAIVPDMPFVDRAFGAFKVDFAGMSSAADDENRDEIMLDNSGNSLLTVSMTTHEGDQKTVEYVNSKTGHIARLSDDNDDLFSVIEMANTSKDGYIVLGNEDEGYLVQVTTITNDTGTASDDEVVFTDVFSGDTYSGRPRNSVEGTAYVTVGGNEYAVTYQRLSGEAGTVRVNYPDSNENSGSLVVYPTVQTEHGANVFFYQPLTINLSSVDGAGTDITRLKFPDGDGYTDVTFALGTGLNWTLAGGASGTLETGAATTTTDVNASIGRLTYVFNRTSVANQTTLYLRDTAGSPIGHPAFVMFEDEDENNVYNAVIVKTELAGDGGSDDDIGVNSPEFTWGNTFNGGTSLGGIRLETNDDLYMGADYFGTFITRDTSDTDQHTATISYPDEHSYAQIYVAEQSAVIGSGNGTTTPGVLGSITVMDTEVSQVSNKNLIVLGGSCVNTVASTLIGGTGRVCGADFTARTGVGSGQYLIQSFRSPLSTTKVAVLVAGYEAEDTRNAAKALSTQTIDTTVGKKYTGSTSSSVTPVVTS